MDTTLNDERHSAVLEDVALATGLTGLRVESVIGTSERGTNLKVTDGAERFYALKYVAVGVHSPNFAPYRAAKIAREAQILADLGSFTDGLLAGSGSSTERTWLLTHWRNGESLGRYCRDLRGQKDPLEARRQLLGIIIQVFEKVAALHDRGYTHGDIQPMHFLRQPNGLSLLDFELARRHGEDVPYKGALIHFCSPEVAVGMKARAEDIPYDVLSEVYSVGSTAFLLFTGQTSTDYGAPREELSMTQMLDRIIGAPPRSFAEAGLAPLPEVEAVLQKCLAKERGKRYPSLHDAAEALRSIDLSS